MNKKKYIYITFTLIIFIVGYFNYFYVGKEFKKEDRVILTEDVYYRSKDYTVEAKTQSDYLDSGDIVFDKAKTIIKGIDIYGNTLLIDKSRNVFVKNKIVGSSPSGWAFKTDELNYNKEKDLFNSDKHIVLEHKLKNIKIEGDSFESNGDMSFLSIKKNFVFYKGNVKISSNKAEYNDKDKTLKFIENIKVTILNNDKVEGNFESLLYNIDKGNFISEDDFVIKYDGSTLKSNHISYSEEKQELFLNNEVTMEKDEYIIKSKSGYKAPNSDLITFNNSVTLKENVQILEAEKYLYNIANEEVVLTGNAKYTEKDNFIIVSDKIEQIDDQVSFTGEENDVKITTKVGVVLTKNAIYDKNSDKLYSTVKYNFDDGKSSTLKGDKFEYYLKNNLFNSFGNTKYKTSKMELETSDLNLDSFGKIKIDNPYKIKSLESGAVLNGKSAIYNNITKDFINNDEFLVVGEDFTLAGKSLVYNTSTETLNLHEPFEYKNVAENAIIKGDSLKAIENNIIEVRGSSSIKIKDLELLTEKFTFNKSKGEVAFPDNIIYSLGDKEISGTVKSGVYLTDKAVFIGEVFYGKNNQSSFKGNEVKIFKDDNRIELYKNAEIKSNEFTLNSEEIIYFPDLEKMASSKNIKIKSSKFSLNMSSGTIILNKKITGKNAILNIENAYEFRGDDLDMDFTNLKVLFKNNTNGFFNIGNNKTSFNANITEILMQKDGSNYELKALSLLGNARLYDEMKEFSSNNIFYRKSENKVTTEGNSSFKIKNKNGGIIEVFADSYEFSTTENKIELKNNVRIKNIKNNQLDFEIKSDNASMDIQKNIISFFGNVSLKKDGKEIRASEAHFNIDTKNIDAKGNIRIKYIK